MQVTVRCHEALHAVELVLHIMASTAQLWTCVCHRAMLVLALT